MSLLDAVLQPALDLRRQQHRYRQRRTVQSAQGPVVTVDGKSCLAFCSNDYLGLANHPRLKQAAITAVQDYGTGSGASHLVCGHSRYHQQLELAIAELTGRERVLLFSTGYMANLGTISALLGRGDQVFEDRLNHASLLDGGLISGARFQRFAHNDVDDLRGRLQKSANSEGRKLIAVDGVFSMDGDLAPIPALASLAAAEQAWLMVDDAHGFGVLGRGGGGVVEHYGLSQNEVPVLMGTLGKALGSFGAFVAGSETLIETLIQFARPYIYTTALPPAAAAASLAGIALLREESWRRSYLLELVEYFKAGVARLGLQLGQSDTAIQPLLVGDDARALAISQGLEELGLWVTAIRPPTVPEGTARLRITLSAAHTKAHIDQLLEGLEKVCHGQ